MNNVKHFKKIATELGELYEVKDRAYGSSFSNTYKKLGIISAVTRISDKFNRLCNLATNPDIDNLGENLEDTLRDMASYCIMTVMELENERNLVNDKIMRCIEIEEGIVTSKEDKQIRKGDVFECIKELEMPNGEKPFKLGATYKSDTTGCITDENGLRPVFEDDWWYYFKRI